MKQYVQHISRQGEKFRVDDSNLFCWEIFVSDMVQNCWVPKSEYRLCEPPEQWEDVTRQCSTKEIGIKGGYDGHYVMHGDNKLAKLICGGGYRISFIGGTTLIEKKVTE